MLPVDRLCWCVIRFYLRFYYTIQYITACFHRLVSECFKTIYDAWNLLVCGKIPSPWNKPSNFQPTLGQCKTGKAGMKGTADTTIWSNERFGL